MKKSVVVRSKVRLRTLLRRFGLPHTCSEKDASEAYRDIAKQIHPDLNPNSKSSSNSTFTMLKSDYDELRELLKKYPPASRTDFGSENVTGQNYYSNPSVEKDTEKVTRQERHRDRSKNFHPNRDKGFHQRPPPPPLHHRLAVAAVVAVVLYGLWYLFAVKYPYIP